MLRLRLDFWQATGTIMDNLGGWEFGRDRKTQVDILKLYTLAAERYGTRDYTEGAIGSGGAAIDGLVYLPELLRFCLRHRSADRLFAPPCAGQPAGADACEDKGGVK